MFVSFDNLFVAFIGKALYDNLERLPQKIAVIVSADLAHTHEASGPYGYSPAAEPFDRVRTSGVTRVGWGTLSLCIIQSSHRFGLAAFVAKFV